MKKSHLLPALLLTLLPSAALADDTRECTDILRGNPTYAVCKRAAERGDADSQERLSEMYESGEGVQKNNYEAYVWALIAASRGAYVAPSSAAYLEHFISGKEIAAAQEEAVRRAADMPPASTAAEAQVLLDAAKQGDAAALFKVAYMYYQGTVVIKNYGEATKRMEKAAADGYAEAQHFIGHIYANGEGVHQNHIEAVKWWRKAAAQGHAEVQYHLAEMYYHGNGVKIDRQKAYVWTSLSAQQGFEYAEPFVHKVAYDLSEAQIAAAEEEAARIAADYADTVASVRQQVEANKTPDPYEDMEKQLEETGTAGIIARAFIWLASHLPAYWGDAFSQYVLAGEYERKGDYETAVKWYRKSAEGGNRHAQAHLGDMYESGRGVPLDYAEALKWHLQSAHQRGVDSQRKVAFMYYEGRGTPQDYDEAYRWFLGIAEWGDPRAQLFIGIMHANGESVPQDKAEAARWYFKAAEKGDSRAQHHLGEAYHKGEGVDADPQEAYIWTYMAASRGDAYAYEFLQKAERELTTEQITAAKEEAVRRAEAYQ